MLTKPTSSGQTEFTSSSHTVKGMFAVYRRVFHSLLMLESVNRCAICVERAKGVRSSLPNLDESTNAYNICEEPITLRLICASDSKISVMPRSRLNPLQERNAF